MTALSCSARETWNPEPSRVDPPWGDIRETEIAIMHITKTSPPSMKPVITTGPKKGSAVRHSRPLHHRRTSSVQPFVALNTSKSYQSISKLLGAGGGSTVRTTNRIDDEDMATSFLQYWYVLGRSMNLGPYLPVLVLATRPTRPRLPSARLLVPFAIQHFESYIPCLLNSASLCQDPRLTHIINHSAMCETQIMIPDNSVLYCSERYLFIPSRSRSTG